MSRSEPPAPARLTQRPPGRSERLRASTHDSPSCGQQNAWSDKQQHTLENAECGQRATERPCEMISRGSRHTGRGAAGEGGGRRLTCACRARAAPFAAVDGERSTAARGQIGGRAAEGRTAFTRKAASWTVPWRSYRGGRAVPQGPGAAAPPPGCWAVAEWAAADRCGRAER